MSVLPFGAVFATIAMFGLVLISRSPAPAAEVGYYTATREAAAGVATPAAVASAVIPIATPVSPPAPPRGLLTPNPVGEHVVVMRGPSVNVTTIRRVLAEYNSPAVDEAQTIYDLGVAYGIDPAVCLAFFVVESSAGTKGIATKTKSLGNIRSTPGYVDYHGYRQYATWRDGIEDWYRLISRLYVGEWGLTTVDAIVPVYAPTGDNNDPDNYARTVRRLVGQWSSRADA